MKELKMFEESQDQFESVKSSYNSSKAPEERERKTRISSLNQEDYNVLLKNNIQKNEK